MKRKGWVVHHRRLTGAVLLGACLLLGAGRLLGQSGQTPSASREVIATSVAVTPQTPAPAMPVSPPPVVPAAGLPSLPSAAAPPPSVIQPVSYVPAPQAGGANGGGANGGGANGGGTGVSPVLPSGGTSVSPVVGKPPAPAAPIPPSATEGAGMLSPTALLSGMRTNAPAVSSPQAAALPTASVSVEVTGPDQLLLGKPLAHEIVIRNTGGRPVAELHVEEPLPAGAHVVKTEPRALTRGNRLIWDLRNLEIGGERRLLIELNLTRGGDLDLRPYVTFLSGDGLRTKVTRPPFSVEISADPTRVPRGGRIRFTIRVANHGTAPVYNIHLYDQLPPGLHHPQGPKIGTDRFGDLLPGETRTITLETTAVQSGSFRNEVMAQADRGVEGRAVLDVVVTEPSLSLRLEGPARMLTQREAEFHLEAGNPGALTAKNVRLVQTLPPTLNVTWTSAGASLDSSQHALVWSLSDLAAGQRQTVTFRVKADLAGDWPLSAALLSQNLPEARATHTLHAEAAAELKLDVRAPEDRLSVGEETVFHVHVFNKGDAPCAGLRLTAVLPEAVTPVDAQGPSAAQIDKQQVSFAPLAQLDAHGDVVYRIHVRARQEGKGAFRVELTAQKQAPAQSETSIQVQGGAAVSAQQKTGETPVPPTLVPLPDRTGGTPLPPGEKKIGETPVPPAQGETTKLVPGETLR